MTLLRCWHCALDHVTSSPADVTPPSRSRHRRPHRPKTRGIAPSAVFVVVVVVKPWFHVQSLHAIIFGSGRGYRCQSVCVCVWRHFKAEELLLLERPQSTPRWYPSPRPASPCVQCKHALLYRSAPAAGWLTTPTVTGQQASRPACQYHQPASQPRPPRELPSQTLVILILVLIISRYVSTVDCISSI